MTAWVPKAPDGLALAQVLRGTGEEYEFTVQGTSMRGSFRDGSRIRIRCDGVGPTAGQVVAFVRQGHLVAHRLVSRGGGPRAARYLVTAGDNTVICDAPVAADAVLGSVVAWECHGTWRPIPEAPVRRGWRRAAAPALLGGVRLALWFDVRLARALIGLALLAQRLLAGTRGGPAAQGAASMRLPEQPRTGT